MNPPVEYLPDECVDNAMDAAIRSLLTTCFTSPADAAIFQTRRYWIEPYRHRWIIRAGNGRLVAHAGLHERFIETDDARLPIGGVAEVCVLPEHRGRGYVKAMLAPIHAALRARQIPFALLFGDPGVYASSGYFPVTNLHLADNEGIWRQNAALANAMGDAPWPGGQVRLPGPKF